ncbi:protein tramtrack, alpha isoform-like isoform X4 [Thrips palmi]|uniref:Protein tramtrack, alpha isoform-like isoform X4 n=1 Tax=Thrips palmi TaxID=161013 RepID=A0A6P9ACN3_THRPL|nr:protein tramtrack, alpha isoform-like isoform X4 [Thrips palmi]
MSGTAMQQFRLRWNNHQPNFISVFTTLLNSESLVDVTLGAEGKHVQAHKVVLSACSSYFQSLFTLNPCQHPIVILKDVKYDDLKVIVDFMYYGEVNVSQEQLPAILKTAEMLKVKGLAEMPAQNNISMSKSRSLSSDKGDDIATPPGDSASGWGSDSVRHSPSPQPMSPAMRRKRLRKTSTGSGSGSTERTSEEQSVDINVVKAEPMSFQSEGESIRSSSSLRNSLQEASTESEPPDGSTESVEDPNIHSSHDSVSGPNVDNPGSSAIYNPTPGNPWLNLPTEEDYMISEEYREKRDIAYHDTSHLYIEPTPRSSSFSHLQMAWPTPTPTQTDMFHRRKPQENENFKMALDAVMNKGIGFCRAARIFGVNNRTLWLECRRLGFLNPRSKVNASHPSAM